MTTSFRDAAIAVLTEQGNPMSVAGIWKEISARRLVETSGSTPEQTLHTTLLRGTTNASLTRGDDKKVFVRVAPGMFGLAAWGAPPAAVSTATRPSASTWRANKMALRTSSDAARELFEWMVPDASVREPLARFLARVIREADVRTHGNGWSITMRRRSIVVNVGALSILTLERKTCSPLLDPSGIDGDLVTIVAGPAQPPHLKWCEVETNVLLEMADAWWPALTSGIDGAARTADASRYTRWHSPGVLGYLADLLGEEMPAARIAAAPESIDDEDDDEEEVRYWKISPERGAELWPQWRDQGYASIGWGELGDILGLSDEEFELRLTRAQEHNDEMGEGPWQALRFTRLRAGDILLANRGISEVLGIGKVTGPCRFDANAGDHAYRVAVEWFDTRPRAVDMRGWRSTFIRVKSADAERIIGAPIPETEPGTSQLPPAASPPPPPMTVARAAAETGFDEREIDSWLRIWRSKKHLILQGPPGTGKTFVAQRLARILAAEDRVELVQFHAAYTYEDFIQGLRPQVVNGQLQYGLEPGRFLSFCDRAQRSTSPTVLIIDEINRANVPRVFGELMYLLEYRDQTTPLAAGGQLRVPKNVFLLGTMNTADRSIARMDHALRRRFAFVRLEPKYEVLRASLAMREVSAGDALVGVLERLNETINDPNFAIGISYFMREDIGSALPDIWRSEIEPHLEEFFYDARDKVKSFRWSELAKSDLAAWR